MEWLLHLSFTEDNGALRVSQADIKLSGPTSELSLEVNSKQEIDFRNIFRSLKEILREVETS